MRDLNIVDIIGLVLCVICLAGVFSTDRIADKLVKYKDKETVNRISLYIKIAILVLAVIAFILVVVF